MSEDADKTPAEGKEKAHRVTIPHARRFSVITGVLFVVALFFGLGAVILIDEETRPKNESLDLTWSGWRPESDGPDKGAFEIANHVAPEYRQANGQQLVATTGGPMEFSGLPINIALRPPEADKGEISLLPGNGVLYRMCGLGPDCALDRGVPSQARQLLLRRQAMELALYSFQFLDKKDVEFAAVLLPPAALTAAEKKLVDAAEAAGRDPKTVLERPDLAILFSRETLEKQLDKPLRETLSEPTPTPRDIRKAKGSTLVDQLTTKFTFNATFQESNNDGFVFMVLDEARTSPILLGGKTGGNQDLPPGAVSEADRKRIESAPRAPAGTNTKTR